MSNQNDVQRTLGRMGARELTAEEVLYVNGAGQFHTLVCTIDINTGAKDGDAC